MNDTLEQKKCEHCRWFYSSAIYGKHSINCQTLGSKRTDLACISFVSNLSTDDGVALANALDPRVITDSDDRKRRLLQRAGRGNLDDVDYRKEFQSLLAEIFILERDAKMAVSDIREVIHQQGKPFELEGFDFDRYADKLTSLVLLYKLCQLYGMGMFAEDIVKEEIAARFGRHVEAVKPQRLGNEIQKITQKLSQVEDKLEEKK